MHTRKIISMFLVLTLALGPVLAWPDEFNDEDENYLPDEVDSIPCDLPDGDPRDKLGTCSEDDHFSLVSHDFLVKDTICFATAQCDENGYYHGPDLGDLEDEIESIQEQIDELLEGNDDPVALIEQAVPVAYDSLALTINTAHSTAAGQSPVVANSYLHMERGTVDRDGDGVPDFYVLTFAEKYANPALHRNETIYIQSDFINGPYQNNEAFIIDPLTGDALGAGLDIDEAPGKVVLKIFRNGQLYATLTLDTVDFSNTLVYRVVDEESQFSPSPTYSTSVPLLEIQNGDAVWFSAPMDQSYVRLWPPYDMDADGVTNEREVPLRSHPINGASLPNNLDGDACVFDAEPDPKAKNDQNRAVCLPFGYDLEIVTPDSDPTDPLVNYIWDTVPLHFSATPKQDFIDAGIPIPDIKYWELWLTHPRPELQHSSNRTVTNTYGGWHHEDVYHEDDCDMLPANPPESGTTTPQEGVTHDGDGKSHSGCKFFYDPSRSGTNTASWIYHTQLASGQGSFYGLQETLTLDTSLYADSEYHIFMYVCLETQDDCSLPFQTSRDVREQFASTPHIYINNKPIVRPLAIVDLDNVTERSTVDYSGAANFTFEAFQPLGEPMSTIKFQVDAWGRNDQGRKDNRGRCSWTFDVFGMDPGHVRNGSRDVATDSRCDTTSFTITKMDHLRNATGVIIENPQTGEPIGGVYNITMDTRYWPWHPNMVGGDITLSGNALIEGIPSSFGVVDKWPAEEALHWFTNRAPEVTLAGGADVASNRESGTATTTLVFDYLDRDENEAQPTATLGLINATGNHVALIDGDCTKIPHPNQVAQNVLPADNYDARYECGFTTDLFGTFHWQLNVTDPDGGDNRTTNMSSEPIELVNRLPALSDPSIRPNAAESAGSDDTRTMDFQIRYIDPDDAPERVWVEVYEGQGPNAELVDEYDMEAATDCLGDPTTINQSTTDLCVSVDLGFGEYSAKFLATSIRDGSATYPDDGRINFTVGGAIETPPCYACGTDEETMDALTDTAREAMLAANEAFLDVPPLAHPGQLCGDQMPNPQNDTVNETVYPWLPPGVGECNPNDRDGDGYPNSQEIGDSDPDDPWSTPMDSDADLVPEFLERGPLDVNLFTVREGFIGLKTEAYITGYVSLDRNAQTPERFNISLLREDEFYNVTIRPTNTGATTTYAGLFMLDYVFTDTGFNMTGYDHTGNPRLQIMYDRANIGTEEMALRVWTPGHDMRVWTAPFTAQYNAHVVTAPAGLQPEPDGTYSLWTDLNGDGQREPFPPTNVDLTDSDGDNVPDMVEGLICSSAPLPNCDGNNLGGLPENCGLLNDYDCDGATDWEEISQGCSPADPESNPYDGCDSPLPPGGEDPVGSLTCSGYGPTQARDLAMAIANDADCDGRTNGEELPDSADDDPTAPVDPQK